MKQSWKTQQSLGKLATRFSGFVFMRRQRTPRRLAAKQDSITKKQNISVSSSSSSSSSCNSSGLDDEEEKPSEGEPYRNVDEDEHDEDNNVRENEQEADYRWRMPIFSGIMRLDRNVAKKWIFPIGCFLWLGPPVQVILGLLFII